MEKYIDIIGYETHYQISNKGNVKSKDRVVKYSNGNTVNYKGKKRKPSISEYRMIALSKNSKVVLKKISRLVAIHFIDNPENKKVVNHKDGNKLNDDVANLEWSTHSENSLHSFEKGLSKKKNKVSGVFFEARRNKWASYLYRKNKSIFIGRYETEKEAILYRQKYLDGKDNN